MLDNIVMLGINHRKAPLEVREPFSCSEGESPFLLKHLCENEGFQEAVLLSTCNRTEVYGLSLPVGASSYDTILASFCALRGISPEIAEGCLYGLSGKEAAGHLFAVACGIDSMVLGEDQILGQVKKALFLSREAATAGPVMNRLFLAAIRTGKRARAETTIGRGISSVSSAALQMARHRLGALRGKKILLIGAGETALLVLRHIVLSVPERVYVANRTYAKACELSGRYGALPLELDSVAGLAGDVDIVISAIDAPQFIITREMMESHRRAVMMMDLSVPRSIDPEVAQISGVSVLNIDDLQDMVRGTLTDRKEEVNKIELIIEEELRRYFRVMEAHRQAPLIRRTERLVRKVREEVLHQVLVQYPMKKKERELLQYHSRRIVMRVFHRMLKAITGKNRND